MAWVVVRSVVRGASCLVAAFAENRKASRSPPSRRVCARIRRAVATKCRLCARGKAAWVQSSHDPSEVTAKLPDCQLPHNTPGPPFRSPAWMGNATITYLPVTYIRSASARGDCHFEYTATSPLFGVNSSSTVLWRTWTGNAGRIMLFIWGSAPRGRQAIMASLHASDE